MLKRKNAISKSPLCCEDRKIVSDEPVTWKERYCAPASSILCACLRPGFFIPETRPTMTTDDGAGTRAKPVVRFGLDTVFRKAENGAGDCIDFTSLL
jgi:hypothetical protein